MYHLVFADQTEQTFPSNRSFDAQQAAYMAHCAYLDGQEGREIVAIHVKDPQDQWSAQMSLNQFMRLVVGAGPAFRTRPPFSVSFGLLKQITDQPGFMMKVPRDVEKRICSVFKCVKKGKSPDLSPLNEHFFEAELFDILTNIFCRTDITAPQDYKAMICRPIKMRLCPWPSHASVKSDSPSS